LSTLVDNQTMIDWLSMVWRLHQHNQTTYQPVIIWTRDLSTYMLHHSNWTRVCFQQFQSLLT